MKVLSDQEGIGYAVWIGDTARWALDEEVKTTPKPGLVDLASNGAHSDMDALLFFKSARTLMPYFAEAAWMGLCMETEPEGLFVQLRQWGKRAERAMYMVTEGVNTHKGAIFTMGIFCAIAGRCIREGKRNIPYIRQLERQMVMKQLQQEIEALSQRNAVTHGENNFCRYGSRGVRGMAIDGYREVFEKALPVLREGIERDENWNTVKLQVLITLMSCVEDSNIISRSDPSLLRAVQLEMKDFLLHGGAYQKDAIRKLERMDEKFVLDNISGGGSADLLALTIFLDRILIGNAGK